MSGRIFFLFFTDIDFCVCEEIRPIVLEAVPILDCFLVTKFRVNGKNTTQVVVGRCSNTSHGATHSGAFSWRGKLVYGSRHQSSPMERCLSSW